MAEIPKAYEPQAVEDKWYQFWLDQKCFVADPTRVSPKRPAYSIVIPPPNVTGMLHMGHVLNNTIQDILSRKARMDGKEVLWLPGTDHAGIATQVQVERALKKEEKKTRHDLGREEFLKRVWTWKEKHGGIIIQQLKKLGASCDWTRERFTMDPEYSRCVQQVFVDLYKKDMIYRGKRMVNWCPVSQTALSDEEVEMKPQKGFMYHFKVEVAEMPGTWLTIATTRPETIPGDTAVAVNPKDPRYTHLIGKHILRPLPVEVPQEKKLIPIIGDEHVDFEFGTGVLKVTPAHDKADFEIGQRHKLAVVDIMNPDGTMNALAGQDLATLDRFAARKVAAEKLRELGSMVEEKPYENNVGFSQRADVPIEPRLSEQWFLKYPSVKPSKDCVAEGRMKFYPDRWAKVYDHWLTNIQDWCISRQLWWGHRIPVWYNKQSGETYCGLEAPKDPENWTQDPDVLDTWFSSWLWPFATMGWPEQTPTLKAFYPTTDLVTGPDIIFFWVARMIMAGYEYMHDLPFRNVYFTGIIRDKQGRKMSKSLGNSPDPLDLIKTYGADALRFGTMRGAPLGQDVLFDEKDVELGRNFCNKLWNACRYRQMQGGEVQGEIDPNKLFSDDKWILLRLNTAIKEMDTAFVEYRFNDATATLYRFFWSEFCDWYLESTKAVLQGTDEPKKANTLAVIDFILSHTLRLFHPFLPFITEELWHGMGYSEDMPEDQGGKSIMFAAWPKTFDADFRDFYSLDDCYLEFVEAKHELIAHGRNLRAEARIASNKKVNFILKREESLPTHDMAVVKLLLNAESFTVDPSYQPAKGTLSTHTGMGELYMPTEGLIDVAAEIARLEKELEKHQVEIEKVQVKLNNPAFAQKVPPAVLEDHQKRLADWQAKFAHVEKALNSLRSA
ncbi:MAG: valyl-tRNA synthetase [Verrucomicrobiales bacterium]|nr:valyl-tRNA synthetase [Verrucomicrobiales bacterium]